MKNYILDKMVGIIISICIVLFSCINVFAIDATEKFEFTENFEGCTSENAYTASSIDDAYELKYGEKVIYEREDGVKWITSSVWMGGYKDNYFGKTYINAESDKMYLKALGAGYLSMVNLDLGKTIPASNVKRIKFTTERGSRMQGMAFFVSDTQKDFILFGQKNGEEITGLSDSDTNYAPYIAVSQSGTINILKNDLKENGWSYNDNILNWEIIICGTVVNYKATSGNGTVWSGKLDIGKYNFMDDYKYVASFAAYGDGNGGILRSFSLETGDYYIGGMGEPPEILYYDIAENKEDLGEGLYKFDTSAPVRRIVSRQYKNVTIGLSEDNVTFDEFYVDASGNFLNLINDKNYSYIKLPGTLSSANKLFVFTDLQETDKLVVKKGNTRYIYFAKDGIPIKVNWSISKDGYANDEYATVDQNGKVRGIRDGQVVIETNELKTNVKIVGLYTEAIETGDAGLMSSYITSQQSIIDNLNDAIENNNIGGIKNFLTDNSVGSLYDMDLISNVEYANANTSTLQRMAERLTSYSSFTISSIDDILEFGNTLLKERYVDEFLNLSGSDDIKNAIASYGKTLGLPTNSSYYTNFEDSINDRMRNKTFANYFDLRSQFIDNMLLVNVKENINKVSLINMLEDYEEKIGYNISHYNSLKDKDVFIDNLIQNTNSINTITDLKVYMDSYVESTIPPAQPKQIGGGGGGGSGGVSLLPTPTQTLTPTNQSGNPSVIVEKKQLYSDVNVEYWGYEAIRYLSANGAIAGYEDGSFMPEKSVSRAEFIQMLMKIFGKEIDIEDSEELCFDDVLSTEWYYQSIAKAKKMGILIGSDNKCNPNTAITRQEMAAIIYRIADSNSIALNTNTPISKFNDESAISAWAKTSILKLQASGIISGIDGSFCPNNSATRAMAAQMIFNLKNTR